MSKGVEVIGTDKVSKAIQLRSIAARSGGNLKLAVGYSAPYALHVHEDLEIVHPVGKAKFLTGPERRIHKQMVLATKTALIAGKTPRAALHVAGRMLVEESVKEVPVDTGNLRRSIYITVVGSDK